MSLRFNSVHRIYYFVNACTRVVDGPQLHLFRKITKNVHFYLYFGSALGTGECSFTFDIEEKKYKKDNIISHPTQPQSPPPEDNFLIIADVLELAHYSFGLCHRRSHQMVYSLNSTDRRHKNIYVC